tara:strand:- start:628 stop:942 length:315 start_codon:yes stop_codon:yes gene_type:complete
MNIPYVITAVFNNDLNAIKDMSVEQLIEKDNMGRNAGHAACHKGYFEILTYLLKDAPIAGRCNPDDTDNDGHTMAHYCCGLEWKLYSHPIYAEPIRLPNNNSNG